MKNRMKGLLSGILIGVFGLVLYLTGAGFSLEQRVGLSWLFHLRGERSAPSEVAVVGINGQTAGALGLPDLPRDWPRSIHGELIDKLLAQGAALIVLDIFFGPGRDAREDGVFTESVASSGRVALVEKLTGKRQPLLDAQGLHSGTIWVEELVSPMPELAAASIGLGPFPLPKIDAAVYEFWTFKESLGDVATLPAVAMHLYSLVSNPAIAEAVEQLLASGTESRVSKATAETLREEMRFLYGKLRADIGDSSGFKAALADQALLQLYHGDTHRFLNFYGPPGRIATIPYQSVIVGEDPNLPADAMDFSGKVVFVGFSDLYDPGHLDRFYTVFTSEDGVDLSGVEIMATAFSNLLYDESLRPMPFTDVSLLLLGVGIIAGFVVWVLPGSYAVMAMLALLAVYVSGAQWLFNTHHMWLPLAIPVIVQIPLALFVGLLGQYVLERRHRVRIGEALNYYLPENVARELTEKPLAESEMNRVVYSTCLATDMVGFSTLAEKLKPEALAVILNDYFDSLAQPLKRYGVDVTEFRADAIMCAWTASNPAMAVRENAVHAALAAVTSIDGFKERHEMPGMSVRIGLECGQVYVGNAGGGGHFVYSIVGDCANTASRIEGLNKHLGTQLLASMDVVEGVDNLLVRLLGKFVFVGKSEALSVVEIVAAADQASARQRQLCNRFSTAYQAFCEGTWEEARLLFSELLQEFPQDGPSRFYRQKCEFYLTGVADPATAGIIVMGEK